MERKEEKEKAKEGVQTEQRKQLLVVQGRTFDGRAWPGLTWKWKAALSICLAHTKERARQGRLVAMRTGK